MARLSFRNVNKIYDNKVQAVFDFNLEVQDKEFIVFVGPSGCGKSTTLRMLAGLENISSGEIYLNDTLINDVAPVDRDMAMVFQNYALYPHMSVYDNLAFGLKMRKFPTPIYDEENKLIPSIDVNRIKDLNYDIKVLNKEIKILNKKIAKAGDDSQELKEEIAKKEAKIEEINKQIDYYSSNLTTYKFKMAKMPKAQIDERVKYAAEILGLKEYLKRKPANLSGGQRQRVALGRAIVRTPKVFLMDEPLSNLDAKLRVQMRSEIAKIHKKVGATTVYVTHDQTEAMTMADRIVVMKDGYVQQIGSPKEVYNNPENIFVAGFIGSPAMNFIKGIIKDDKFYVYKIINSLDDSSVEEVEITDKYIQLNQNLVNKLKDYNDKAIILGIRPEDIHSVDDNVEEKSNIVDLRCEVSELLGHETIIYGSLEGQTVVSKAPAEIIIETDDIFKCVFDLKKVHFFDLDTTKVIK